MGIALKHRERVLARVGPLEMSAPSAGIVRWGRERARIGPWRGDATTAFLSPVPGAPAPSREFVYRCLETLAAKGYTRVVTGALSPSEQAGFLAAGFWVRESLELLAIDLDVAVPLVPRGWPIVRVSRRRWHQVLAIDEAAFPFFWRFDRLGLQDALHATPESRMRVCLSPGPRSGPALGYAICGRAGARGFVQRLAVCPSMQRQGLGRRLLSDGLSWMRSGGVRTAMVNTQAGNHAALALYLEMGFRREPAGLSVLSAGLA